MPVPHHSSFYRLDAVPGRRSGYKNGPTTEHGMTVSLYQQQAAAGGPQMLHDHALMVTVQLHRKENFIKSL